MQRIFTLIIGIWLLTAPLTAAQSPDRPMIHPFENGPGPNSWLLGQPYGNTTGAFNFGSQWYSAGQGLHFGLDYPAPCGTPLVAVADGFVAFADNFSFGSRPHNLILRHPDIGLSTLYGHLQNTPLVNEGEPVTQGQLVGYSGDPDGTCDSRPHLHLEVRSLDYRTALNPADYIDGNFHSLMIIGSFSSTIFTQDFYNARRWMSVDDQPDVAFGGPRLNAYQAAYPPARRGSPSPTTPPLRDYPALDEAVTTELVRVGYDQCCRDFYWHPTDSSRFFTVDGSPNQLASIAEWAAPSGEVVTSVGSAPRPYLSPNGDYEISRVNGTVQITRLEDGTGWTIDAVGDNLPTISPDGTRLLWTERVGDDVPGMDEPDVTLFISDINGENVQEMQLEPGTDVRWLDSRRVLLAIDSGTATRLGVMLLDDRSVYMLGTWDRLRGLSVAPGGERVMFYVTNQPDPSTSGVYVIETREGARAAQLPWFGGWRWRDAQSVYYVPFEPDAPSQQLRTYNLLTGEDFALTNPQTQPFIIMDGRWEVSPDGRFVLFHNLSDRNLWLLRIGI